MKVKPWFTFFTYKITWNAGKKHPEETVSFHGKWSVTDGVNIILGSHVLGNSVWCQDGQISSGILVGFNCFKERFEVPCTKALWINQAYYFTYHVAVFLLVWLYCIVSVNQAGGWAGGGPHLVVVSLYDFQEKSGPVLNWLGEDLK